MVQVNDTHGFMRLCVKVQVQVREHVYVQVHVHVNNILVVSVSSVVFYLSGVVRKS